MIVMKVIVRATSDDVYDILTRKIRSSEASNIEIIKENKKWAFITLKVPQSKAEFLYEILELGGTLERDVKNDLD